MPRGPKFIKEEIPQPYTLDLLETPVIRDPKASKIPLYNEMTDPYNHLDNFQYTIDGRRANKATKCCLFPIKLKSPVMSWFKRLVSTLLSSERYSLNDT